MPAQQNASNTARHLSQATTHFDGSQLDHHFPRRSGMPGQLNLVNPPHSLPLNALANVPPASNPSQIHINLPALPSPFFKPRTIAFPVNPTSIPFCSFAATRTTTTRQQPRGK